MTFLFLAFYTLLLLGLTTEIIETHNEPKQRRIWHSQICPSSEAATGFALL